jgi:hypothetical protein
MLPSRLTLTFRAVACRKRQAERLNTVETEDSYCRSKGRNR